MAQKTRWQDLFSIGGRVPWAVGLLLALTIVPSLLVAFGGRHGAPLLGFATLLPAEVWRGEVWRLVTWPLIEPTPLGLIFGCLAHYWLGRDIAEETGSPRFLAVFGGVVVTAAVVTCLVARVDHAILVQPYISSGSLTAAMVIAWGLWFPQRVLRIFFVLPIRGYWLAWLTVAVTVAYAVYAGWEQPFVTLASEASILSWLYFPAVVARWSRARTARRRTAVQRERAQRRARAEIELARVTTDDEEPPPMPAELEARVRELLTAPTKRKERGR